MAGSLSRAQVRSYTECGFLSPLPAISEGEAGAVLKQLRATETQFGPLARVMTDDTHLMLPCLDQLMRDPRILDAVESLIGPDIVCCGGQLFVKEPGAANFLSWHQDGCYWGLMSRDVVTAWLALTPSGPDNGCMRVLPGSHSARLPHAETFAPANMLSHGQAAMVDVQPHDAVDLVLKPGEISLHHSLTVHGSEPNRASYPRIGFAIRYTAAHIHQRRTDGGSVVLVRGTSPADA
jgi:ectoine hydroxylase-related dioxygenase (phytanoyl-CoA dioxygenase family)